MYSSGTVHPSSPSSNFKILKITLGPSLPPCKSYSASRKLHASLSSLLDLNHVDQDVWEHNMVVNCYRLDRDDQRLSEDLVDHRRRDDVLYALMDYDQSIHLPEVTSVKDCCRPANEAWVGAAVYKPNDVCLGEPAYNPFAFDVGMLDNMFRVHFSVS